MKRFPSLKKNPEFRAVYEKGRSKANRLLILYCMENGTAGNRIGISVSKKVGNSVVRHHVTRLLRETFRLHETDIIKGYDFVVVVRAPAAGQSFSEIEKAYLHLMRLQGLMTGE